MALALSVLLAVVESTCVPINSDMFWVTFPDGKGESFVRTVEDPNLLAGPSPWFGVIRPEQGIEDRIEVIEQGDFRRIWL